MGLKYLTKNVMVFFVTKALKISSVPQRHTRQERVKKFEFLNKIKSFIFELFYYFTSNAGDFSKETGIICLNEIFLIN